MNCHTLMEKTSGKQMAKLTEVTPFFINRAEIECLRTMPFTTEGTTASLFAHAAQGRKDGMFGLP